MYDEVELARQKLSTFVDKGAKNMFLSKDVAKRLGVKIKKTGATLKTINFKKVSLVGLA